MTLTCSRRTGLLRATALAFSVVASSSNAGAQAPDQKAAAQAMFDQAKELMAAGNVAKACKRFEESQRLDAGMATQFRLAECYEKLGRTASAWTNYLEVADAAHLAQLRDRENLARERATALKPKLSSLTIVVRPSIAAAPGFELKRDGVVVGTGQWGAPVPVDPGEHTIVASAQGKAAWSSTIRVAGDAAAAALDVPPFGDAAPTATPEPAPPAAKESPAGAKSWRGTLGLVVAGVGVVGIGAGVVLGLLARSKYASATSDGNCSGTNICNQTGLDTQASARGMGTIGTVAFVVGAAAVVGGGVLWLTAPSGSDSSAKEASAAVRIGLGPGSVVAKGAW